MGDLDLGAKEIMAFVPSGKNFRLTLDFYKDMGFKADWESDELAILRIGRCRFFLQKFDNEEMQKNFMMNLEVENLDDWWKKIQATGVQEKYPGTRLVPPKDYPWGKREIHLIGPDGVLWHIAAGKSDAPSPSPEVRALIAPDVPKWIALRHKLWPEESAAALEKQGIEELSADPPLVVFVAETAGDLVGFLELGQRAYAEGCGSSPVPYVEGWYVEEKWRGRGTGGALMKSAESWSRARGFTEMGSDALAENRPSRKAHVALGFKEVEVLVAFRKSLPALPPP